MKNKTSTYNSTRSPSNENMKKLILFSAFFFSVSVYALPDCPSDYSVRWHNCFGSFPFEWGDKYVGEFKDFKLHGQGTYTYADGSKYVGEFKDDKLHGQGTYTYADGKKYVGEFKDDKLHGQGTFIFVDGKRLVGHFMNGQYIPDICEDMGFVKGTESFGNCVNNLIDDL